MCQAFRKTLNCKNQLRKTSAMLKKSQSHFLASSVFISCFKSGFFVCISKLNAIFQPKNMANHQTPQY